MESQKLLTLPGPIALSQFRISSLIASINTCVNSSAVTNVRAIYVHYIALKTDNLSNKSENNQNSSFSSPLLDLNSQQRKLLNALLHYDQAPDTNDPLYLKLINAISENADTVSAPDTYLIRVIPRPGTTSPWSSKATNIAHVCGLSDHVERIERGIAFMISVRKGFPLQIHLQNGIFIDKMYDRMTQFVPKHAPTYDDLFKTNKSKPLVQFNLSKHPKDVIEAANKEYGLALSPGEISYLIDAFASSSHLLTDVELFMFAQVNSEHCRHKIFNADWKIDAEQKPFSLFQMIRNTHEKNNKFTISAYSDNAAVIEGTPSPISCFLTPHSNSKLWIPTKEKVPFLIKVETHNHPTAVSPFQGAATGSGGEIRDEGAVGRGSVPKAGLSGYAVSDLHIPDAKQPWEVDVGRPSHISSALDIMMEAPLGSAAFNNEFGRPCLTGYFRTLTTTTINAHGKLEIRGFHKPIMIAGGVGNVRSDNALKNQKIPPGTALIVLGGPAMLIGLGGGAASSIASGEGSASLDYASVQRSNPEMQRRAQQVINACIAIGVSSNSKLSPSVSSESIISDDNNGNNSNNAKNSNIILCIHDVGAGGLSNAFPELVHDNGVGGVFEIRNVPNTDPSLSPMEIWCCEAQERYVLAVAQDKVDQFAAICERERAPFAVVGHAIAEQRLIVTDRDGKSPIIDLDMHTLFGKPPKMSITSSRKLNKLKPFVTTSIVPSYKDAFFRILKLPSVGSKNFLITIGDRSVGGLTVRDQMVGPWQVPVADVAVTRASIGEQLSLTTVLNENKHEDSSLFKDFSSPVHYNHVGEAFAMGERPTLALINAAASARMAVAESLLNLNAANISGLQHVKLSANWMAAPSHEGEGALLYEAVEAIGIDLCPALGIEIPVGKDSLSMRMKWNDESGTPREVISPVSVNITAYSSVNEVGRTWTPQILSENDVDESGSAVGKTKLILVDLSRGKRRLGGSALAQVYGSLGDEAPDVVDANILKGFINASIFLHTPPNDNIVLAYHDRSDGGLFTTLVEMAFAGRCGLDIILPVSSGQALEYLFNEELGAVFQVREKDIISFSKALTTHGVPVEDIVVIADIIGRKEQTISIRSKEGENILGSTRAELQQAWAYTSYKMQRLRDNPVTADQEYANILDNSDPGLSYRLTFDVRNVDFFTSNGVQVIPRPFGSRPRVAILREQGINGHVEMAHAFLASGFDAVDVHMTDLLSGRMTLNSFVGLAACGGFSYGDVLGAGAGWAKSVLWHADLRREFENFFYVRKDTFALGVCNGCQFLSRLKSIIPGTSCWPTFERNLSEQYEARVSMVEVDDERTSETGNSISKGTSSGTSSIANSFSAASSGTDIGVLDSQHNSGTILGSKASRNIEQEIHNKLKEKVEESSTEDLLLEDSIEEVKPCVFLHGMRGSKFPVVVAHGEGRATFANDLDKKNCEKLVCIRYVDNYGKVTQKYPFNPNGSALGIAGIRNANGRVLALMPHPERVILKEANSYIPRDSSWGDYGPWIQMFQSVRRWVG